MRLVTSATLTAYLLSRCAYHLATYTCRLAIWITPDETQKENARAELEKLRRQFVRVNWKRVFANWEHDGRTKLKKTVHHYPPSM